MASLHPTRLLSLPELERLCADAVRAAGGSPELAGSLATEESSIGAGQLILVLAVALVLGPVQAAGLELTFRGVLLQALGTGLRSPLPPILLMTAVTLIGRELTVAVLIPALALALSADRKSVV